MLWTQWEQESGAQFQVPQHFKNSDNFAARPTHGKGNPIGFQLPVYTDGQDTSPLLLRQKGTTFLLFTLNLCSHSYLPLGYSSYYLLLPSFWKRYLQGNPLLLMVLEALQVSTNWLLNPLCSWTTMGTLKQTKIRLHLLIVWQSYRWPNEITRVCYVGYFWLR